MQNIEVLDHIDILSKEKNKNDKLNTCYGKNAM